MPMSPVSKRAASDLRRRSPLSPVQRNLNERQRIRQNDGSSHQRMRDGSRSPIIDTKRPRSPDIRRRPRSPPEPPHRYDKLRSNFEASGQKNCKQQTKKKNLQKILGSHKALKSIALFSHKTKISFLIESLL